MAVSGLALSCKTHLPLPPTLFRCARQVRFSSALAIETIFPFNNLSKDNSDGSFSGTDSRNVPEEKWFSSKDPEITDALENLSDDNSNESSNASKWKRFSSKELGITNSMISRQAKKVLDGLKKRGFQVYLVGGCVRDLTLKLEPKDFDIITSAELKEVVGTFSRCNIVGRRFPICHVHVDDTYVEVSSFSTAGRKFSRNLRLASERPTGCDDHDLIRWKNSLHRDFTINGLMFDPYAKIVYDYTGGMEDIKKAKVRTIIPASTSFGEDSARILRGIRVAARLGFSFARETAHSLKYLSFSISRLDKGRLLMEMNYLLAYGSAEASLRLLWKFGLLEILLPFQAAYLVQNGFRRRDKRSNMLLAMPLLIRLHPSFIRTLPLISFVLLAQLYLQSLFCNLDKLLAPNRPCDSSLWAGILAFHKALHDQPRDPLVVAAFSLAVHGSVDVPEAVRIVKQISTSPDTSYPELLEPCVMKHKTMVNEVISLAASVKVALQEMTDAGLVSQAMSAYPQAPYSDLVLIPFGLYLKVGRIFGCVEEGVGHGYVAKQVSKIDYKALAYGSVQEIRNVFARIVFDTVFPPELQEDHS